MCRIHRLLPILLGLGLAACGPDEAPLAALGQAPPLIEHTTLDSGKEAALLQARGPCRLTLIGVGFAGEDAREILLRSMLPAGRTLVLDWTLSLRDVPTEEAGRPPPEMAAEGRTEPHRVILHGLLGEQGALSTGAVVWTRPGSQQTFRHAPPVPAVTETIPFGATWELEVVVVADLAAGRVRFVTPEDHALVRVEDQEAGDRIRTFRLLLLVEKS